MNYNDVKYCPYCEFKLYSFVFENRCQNKLCEIHFAIVTAIPYSIQIAFKGVNNFWFRIDNESKINLLETAFSKTNTIYSVLLEEDLGKELENLPKIINKQYLKYVLTFI